MLGYSEEETEALVNKYAREENLTQEQAARELADWHAQYGDLSKLKEMGVDTSYLRQGQTGQQRQIQETPQSQEEPDPQGNNEDENQKPEEKPNPNGYKPAADLEREARRDAQERTILRPYAYNQLKMLRNGVRQTEEDKIWSVEKALMNQDINEDEAKYILEQLGY